MPRSKPKPESEKLQDVVNTYEHFKSVSKAAKLLEDHKKKLGKQKAIRITDTLQIEVSARLTKAEIIERVKRFIYRNQIEEKRACISTLNMKPNGMQTILWQFSVKKGLVMVA